MSALHNWRSWVNDAVLRKKISDAAEKENWSREQLRSEIKKWNAGSQGPPKAAALKAVKPGALDVFRTRVVNGKTLLDLGFSTYLEKSSVKLKIVNDRRFTYRAEVEQVVDGDTLWCVVDLGAGVKTRQKLRLAGIDAPEINSRGGIDAGRYLSRRLKKGRRIVLATTKSDKFDRYLADVWVNEGNREIHINREMVEGASHFRQ